MCTFAGIRKVRTSVLKVLIFNAPKPLVQMSFFSGNIFFPTYYDPRYVAIPMKSSPGGGAKKPPLADGLLCLFIKTVKRGDQCVWFPKVGVFMYNILYVTGS